MEETVNGRVEHAIQTIPSFRMQDKMRWERSYEPYMLAFRSIGRSQSGYVVAKLVEALRYKPESRGFDSQWSHWDFSLT
jgi:hypothetical protein